MKESVVRVKSKAFALRIIRLYKYLRFEKKEFVLSHQILKSGTSIGANVAESECGTSKSDFLTKIYISFRECSETKYWLELLHESDYLSDEEFESIYTDCLELLKLLSSITKSTRDSIINKRIRNYSSKAINPDGNS
ncbi:MAG: four helix bundle protein [Bacteroidaceae bacterium]|nr:four helix bundle protein [Bacteroidaceae bacterium]